MGIDDTLCLSVPVAPEPGRPPIHPIYLDTPMLMSFLATMEDGYYLIANVSRKAARSRKRQTKIAGEGGLNTIASLLGLKATVSGEYKRDLDIASDVAETFTRKHTAASMFNRLYGIFESKGLIKRVHVVDGLYGLRPSEIVEISGTVGENPAEYLFDTLTQVLPIAVLMQALSSVTTPPLPGSQPVAAETPSGSDRPVELHDPRVGNVLERFRADISGGPVTDIVLDAGFCRVIITASRDFLTASARASLVGGSFTTLGKITKIGHTSEDSISIVRRGSLAALAQGQQALVSLLDTNKDKLASEMPSSDIKGPYIQILPLAIYI